MENRGWLVHPLILARRLLSELVFSSRSAVHEMEIEQFLKHNWSTSLGYDFVRKGVN